MTKLAALYNKPNNNSAKQLDACGPKYDDSKVITGLPHDITLTREEDGKVISIKSFTQLAASFAVNFEIPLDSYTNTLSFTIVFVGSDDENDGNYA